MTITYQFDVSTATFCGFAKLLAKWRGSIYKLVYKEMVVYAMAFAALSLAYRLAMTESQRRVFEKVSLYCAHYLDLIPLSFVLGFYVTFVVQRWWNQFTTIPWPDRVMNTVTMYVQGSDERGRLIRRTLMRYLNLSFVLVMTSISVAVKKRFPTLDRLVEAGFLTAEEQHLMESVKARINKYWVPMNWFINLVDQARKEGRVMEGAPVKHILEELNSFRSKTSLLWCYDWVTVPIVYTQVVTWATHIFFLVCLVGRQYLDPSQNYDRHDIDMYVPFFTMLQFFFYMGWLKVAEQLINPFGEDEDDFETNWLVDRNVQVCYLGVDELYGKLPRIEKDIFWDDNQTNVPYTQATLVHKIPNYAGSTMHLRIPENKQRMVHHEKSGNNQTDDDSAGMLQRIKNTFTAPSKEQSTSIPLWKKVSIKSVQIKPLGHRNSTMRDRTRTLGRRESLMAGEFLAMLNRGRKKRASDASQHSPMLTKRNSIIPSTEFQVVNEEAPNSRQSGFSWSGFASRRGSSARKESLEPPPPFEGQPRIDEVPKIFTSSPQLHQFENGVNGPKPYKSMLGSDGHQLLLARLSEIENESEATDGSPVTTPTTTSPVASPTQLSVINPEIGKKLMAHHLSEDNECWVNFQK